MRPTFDQLPADHTPARPYKSAWGLYGDDDELGSLNLLTKETRLRAVQEVKLGTVVPLK